MKIKSPVLNLVEPNILGHWVADRPDLGCAMLIASCQERNIKLNLIKGQTRYIRDMFLHDSDEICQLALGIKDSVIENNELVELKKNIREKGKVHFRDELKDIYNRVFIKKQPRNFFNIELLNRFKVSYYGLVSLYQYYICKLNYYDINFFKRYISQILKGNPRYIGFSLGTEFDPVSRLIRKQIKKITDLPIIAGGSVTSFISGAKLKEVFKQEYVDYLIIGPGEYALPNLLEKHKQGKAPQLFSQGIKELDKLPFPDFSKFDLDLYFNPQRTLPLQDARGCSWRKCAFCDYRRKYSNSYSTFSIERVIQTMQYLKDRYNCRFFLFHNDDLPPGRAKKISEEIISQRVKDISIETYARLVDGFSQGLLSLMRRAGFCSIIWGLESGSQKVLDLMNKGIKIETASRILKTAKSIKIANLCSVIFNYPGETVEDLKKTVSFLKDHAPFITALKYQEFMLSRWAPIYKNYLSRKRAKPKKAQLDKILNKLYWESKLGLTGLSLEQGSRYNGLVWHFYNSGWGILSVDEITSALKNKKFVNFSPLILGKFKKIDKRIFFYPQIIKLTDQIKLINCPERISLDRMEQQIVYLCDGSKPLDEILEEVKKIFIKRYSNSHILNKSINLLKRMSRMNLVLGFKRSLKVSRS